MNKFSKRFLIICLVAFGIGMTVTIIGVVTGGINDITSGEAAKGSKFLVGNISGETNVDKFDSVEINVKESDVSFRESNEYKVEYTYLSNGSQPDIHVENNKLIINKSSEENNNFMNYVGINVNWKSPSITIYYPKGKSFDDIIIESGSDIKINNMKIKKLSIGTRGQANPYGDIYMEDSQVGNLYINSNYGDLNMSNLLVNNLEVSLDYGDIDIERGTFSKSNIKLSSGDLNSQDVNAKNFVVQSKYGDINLDGNFTKETNISSSNGDIQLELQGAKKDYNYEIKTSLGDLKIDDKEVSSQTNNMKAPNNLIVNASLGDISIWFGR